MLTYLSRPRLNALLADAVKHPLTIVRAGAGYGKTQAVYEFTHTSPFLSAWTQLSERDNAGSRFWAKYVRLIESWDKDFVAHCHSLGFPDSEDKLNLHSDLRKRYAPAQRRVIVLDDAHLITHPDILLFLERGLCETVDNVSVILICRELPGGALLNRQIKGDLPTVTEDDLNFTESELASYLLQQGLPASKRNLRDILEDTKGWAFSVNLVARSLKKSPGYTGYVRTAMKQNIFNLMELEVFNVVSERLRRFFIRLSLID
ncbi:MAG: hypothetical protein LBR83_07095, partial [Clostridiales bacterium]|nr:hypothetical protein [Clostridiales bacterium]